MKMTTDELEKWGHQEEKAIKAMPETMAKYRRAVELAETYIENNGDNGALRVLSAIIDTLRFSPEPESDELFQRACQGLIALHNSDNDNVADKAGEIYSALLD